MCQSVNKYMKQYTLYHSLAIYREITFVNDTSVAESTVILYHGLAIYTEVIFVNVTLVEAVPSGRGPAVV